MRASRRTPTETERGVLTEIKTRLQPQFVIGDLLLFGSRAKGTHQPDSDFDVLVITETDIPFVERQALALLALGPREYALDLLVYTPSEIEIEQAIPGSAIYWAMKEGKRFDAI